MTTPTPPLSPTMERLMYQAFEFFCHPFEFHLVPPPPPLIAPPPTPSEMARKIRLPPIANSVAVEDEPTAIDCDKSMISISTTAADKKLARFPESGAAGGPECALCRDVLEQGAVFRLDCATGLSHRFHLTCLGQMLQRPYAHACGLCFAPISPDDAKRIRDAFDEDKRNNRRLMHRLRDEFDDLYELPLSTTATTSQESPVPIASKPVESIVDESLFVPGGITCRCGETRQLAPTAEASGQWNWCPTCQVFVGDGLVSNCKCGDAEADADDSAALDWLQCDGCSNYSHLSCWPQQIGLPDDAPFFCHHCAPVPPSPPAMRAPPPTPASQSTSSGRSSTLSIVVAAPTPVRPAIASVTPTPISRKRKAVSSTFEENAAPNNAFTPPAEPEPPKRIGRRGRGIDDLTCLL
jgi:hypothetical protein